MADERTEEMAEARDLASVVTFGPGFFLGQLRAFARECCPSSAEALPSVALHLATGEVLDLCHVMGLAPAFVALAVHDEAKGGGTAGAAMRTELVPYALITRVTIRPRHAPGAHVGFDAGLVPRVMARDASPEEVLRAASRAPPGERDRDPHGSKEEPS